MKLRPSSLPMIAKCPASWRRQSLAAAEYGPEPDNEAAARGREIHARLAQIVTDGGLSGLISAKDDLNNDVPVRILAARAVSMLSTLDAFSAENAVVYVEKALPTGDRFVFSGTADLVVVLPESEKIIVLDYKSGMTEQEESFAHPQLVCYATLAFMSRCELCCVSPDSLFTDAFAVFGAIIPACGKMGPPVRIDSTTYLAAHEQLSELFLTSVQTNTPRVNPGDHCAFCWAAGKTCRAYENTVHAVVNRATTLPSLETVPDESLADIYGQLKQVAKLKDTIASELRRRIIERNGPCGGMGLNVRKGTVKLQGNALIEACVKWGITVDDLKVAANLKDLGAIVAKKLGVKKVDGVALVATEFGNRAVVGEPSLVLGEVGDDAEAE